MLQHEMKNCVQLPRAEAIARLNDVLRKSEIGGTVMVTRSVTNMTGFDAVVLAVRRQNIWRNWQRRLAECRPRLEVDVRRRACGAASCDVRWSVA